MREWYHIVRHDLEEQTAVLRSLEDEEDSPQVMRILSLCTKHEQLGDLIAVYRDGLEACEDQFPEPGTYVVHAMLHPLHCRIVCGGGRPSSANVPESNCSPALVPQLCVHLLRTESPLAGQTP